MSWIEDNLENHLLDDYVNKVKFLRKKKKKVVKTKKQSSKK